MEAFKILNGIVMPLDRANVDTDAIIPAEYLKLTTRTGFADGLFTNWRYRASATTTEPRKPDPTFVLNMPRYRGATILLAGKNFGCGSSREHAPWALYEYGFRAIIAPSFADIFYNNCFNAGLLPLRLQAEEVHTLFTEVERKEGYRLTIDLATQSITTPDARKLAFQIDPFRKDTLLRGLDPIGRTLSFQDDIAEFEVRRAASTPWLDEALA